jgi:hypothetical protein
MTKYDINTKLENSFLGLVDPNNQNNNPDKTTLNNEIKNSDIK